MSRGGRALAVVACLLVWAVVAVVCAVALFLGSTREVSLASHDAVVSPDFSGEVVLRTGPVLPDVRVASGEPIGVEVQLGKTEVESTEALVERYALIASQPDGLVSPVRRAVLDMARDAAVRGAVLGLVPLLVWGLVGAARRRELARRARSPRGLLAVAVVVLLVVGLWSPWSRAGSGGRETEWLSLQEFLGPEIPVPAAAASLQIGRGATTSGARSLIQSAVDTYDRSLTFYDTAVEAAADVELREPGDDETVVVLVSDRHDNIGMDAVARAVADRAGATAVFDAGDDTSTGSEWEAFSLDSLDAAFSDLDGRWAVPGNHDNGPFVGGYLSDLGWDVLDGTVVEGPGGGRLLGIPDPRSSGLGTWRNETGLSFSEVGDRLADEACAAQEDGERVDTLLVHDANLGSATLERGCADLVIGGHLHVQEGPDAVEGENGEVGYKFTTGTTGGAAYAIAIGSKLRRPAQISLLTYDADGQPVGLQTVLLQTNGRFDVDDYLELTYEAPTGDGTDGGDDLDDEPAPGPDGEPGDPLPEDAIAAGP